LHRIDELACEHVEPGVASGRTNSSSHVGEAKASGLRSAIHSESTQACLIAMLLPRANPVFSSSASSFTGEKRRAISSDASVLALSTTITSCGLTVRDISADKTALQKALAVAVYDDNRNPGPHV
jgi:hypothetical protein